jgi:Glycosyl hydrolases family 43
MEEKVKNIEEYRQKAISQPLIEHIFTADPSAHIFKGKLYLYPSHDIDAGIPFNDNGDHFGMEDYHVIRIDALGSPAVDCGVALHVKDVPWAERQMWAPDAAYKNGKFYLFFPAKRHDGIFQIGVAVGKSPEGPFKPEATAIKGSYSIDPAVFKDDDGQFYMYFGGIWGGQLQKYRNNVYGEKQELPKKHEPSLCPKMARMTANLLEFAEPPRDILILDENGEPFTEGDNDRRFFEASWMHKYKRKYYFSYSTGDTHFLCYAIGDNPYGPFTYCGRIMNPVLGWTTHHSICKFKGKWYVFYHDSTLSEGITHLRSIKMSEIKYDKNGHIRTLNPYVGGISPQ